MLVPTFTKLGTKTASVVADQLVPFHVQDFPPVLCFWFNVGFAGNCMGITSIYVNVTVPVPAVTVYVL